jgi:Ca2+-transporting ATPase
MFSGALVAASVGQGLLVLVSVFALYAYAMARGMPEDSARAMAFAALVFGNIGLIFANRARRASLRNVVDGSNRTLWWLVGGALTGLALSLTVEPLREIFRFGPLSLPELGLAALTGGAGLAVLAVARRLARPTNASAEAAR